MSLLQDALRRAQKGAGARQPPPPGPFPDLPPGKPGPRRKALAGLVAASFVLGAAGVFLLIRPSASRIAPVAQATPPPATAPFPVPAAEAAGAAPGTSPAPSIGEAKPSGRAAGGAKPAGPSVSRVPPLPGAAAGETPEERHAKRDGKEPLVEKFNAAVAALDRGDAEEAVRLFGEVTAASPDLVEAWNGLGLGLLRKRDPRGADEAFSRALALAPRYVPGLLNSGLLRLEQGRAEEAAALFSRAAEISPGSPAPRVNLAVAQARMGRTAEAEETLLTARRRFPGDPDVLYQLGTVYERMGNREKSAEMYSGFLAASNGSRPGLEGRVRERLRSWGTGSRLDEATPRPSQ